MIILQRLKYPKKRELSRGSECFDKELDYVFDDQKPFREKVSGLPKAFDKQTFSIFSFVHELYGF
jgi:hypothetical protein